tara:strand:- start:8044 stop:8361 length:318 start_codon:yes stop_codon:yes gene_type:complete
MNTETTTHTPGPWAYRQSSGTLSFTAKISDSDHNRPSIATIHDSAGRGEANTRLIAAAPDMLEALKACADPRAFGNLMGGHSYDAEQRAMELVREAIAKATGGAE